MTHQKKLPKTIKTAYWSQGQVVKTNTSLNANRAVTQCVAHMQVNQYGASVAEVYDAETAVLHAVVKRTIAGNISIVYRYEPRDHETKLRLAATPLLTAKE
jgi:hypothetical protein